MTKQQKRSFRASFERLEKREVMAAGIMSSLSGGVLLVQGTDQADNIGVAQLNGKLYVAGSSYDVNQVSRIEILAKGGNDTIRLNYESLGYNPLQKLTMVNAGDGNDVVYGSATVDIIFGGAGDDVLYGKDGNDLLFGGAGRDMLFGGNGNDVLDGGADFDYLFGEGGTNLLLEDPVGGGFRSGGVNINKRLGQMNQAEKDSVFALLYTQSQPSGPGFNSQGYSTWNGVTITPNSAMKIMGIPFFA